MRYFRNFTSPFHAFEEKAQVRYAWSSGCPLNFTGGNYIFLSPLFAEGPLHAGSNGVGNTHTWHTHIAMTAGLGEGRLHMAVLVLGPWSILFPFDVCLDCEALIFPPSRWGDCVVCAGPWNLK